MYDEIKKAVEPTKKLTSPLQSATAEILNNRDNQLGRWVQHFYFLYSKQSTVTDAAIKHMESLPIMDYVDTEPTIEEPSKNKTEVPHGKHHAVTAYRRTFFVNVY